MTIIGTPLSDYKQITKRQRINAICALKAIHKYGIIHNDIHEENILVGYDNDSMYFIDFGLAYPADKIKENHLFLNEDNQLFDLLEHYV